MTPTGTPDLLTAGRLARGVSAVNQDLARVAEELTSGLHSDVVAASGGDPTRLYTIERDIALTDGYSAAIDLAQGRASVTQAALGRVQDASESAGASLLAAVGKDDLRSAELIGEEAESSFDAAVAALNARFGDRTLFSGAATTRQAIADADTIIADITTRIAGAADAASVVAEVDAYFADPAGFAATGYLGVDTDAPAAEIDAGQRLSYAVRADDEAIKAALSALAIATVAKDVELPDGARLSLYREAGERGVAATADVVALRAKLGGSEERLEDASIATEARRLFLLQGQAALRARDPFEAATEFSALETQLQTMFSVTARLSSLTLNNFLR